MTYKFAEGTLVEVLPGWVNEKLVGKRFFVEDRKPNTHVEGYRGLGIDKAYRTPYPATTGNESAWVFEKFLKEVIEDDDGFKFDENIQIFTPNELLIGGNAYD